MQDKFRASRNDFWKDHVDLTLDELARYCCKDLDVNNSERKQYEKELLKRMLASREGYNAGINWCQNKLDREDFIRKNR